MSLRVHLLFNFPQHKITALSIFLVLLGVCSVAVTIFGFIEVTWGSYVAAGAWGGGIAIITGLSGVLASYYKGVCSVTTCMVMSYLTCLASVGQGILSGAGLFYESGFYENLAYYQQNGGGLTKLFNGLLLGAAALQLLFASFSAGLCTKHIHIGRQKEKTNSINLSCSSPFVRGNVRASSSSQAPLVSSSKRKKPKNKKQNYNSRQPRQELRHTHLPAETDTHNIDDGTLPIRGRRFGNMPVAGTNIVEEQSRNHSRSSSVRGRRPVNIVPESSRDQSRHSGTRQSHAPRLHGSRYDPETEGLLNRVQDKLAAECGDMQFIDETTPTSPIVVPKATFSELDLMDENPHNRSHRSVGSLGQRSSNFIPITDAIEQPLSIEDDDELPPYVENLENIEEDSLIPISQSGTSRMFEDFSVSSHNGENFSENRELDNFTLKSGSEKYSSPVFQPLNYENKETCNDLIAKNMVRPKSYFRDVQLPMPRERSHTVGSTPTPQRSISLTPDRERFIKEYFFTEQDPQGVSYYGISREGDTISGERKRKRNLNSQHSRERELARGSSLKTRKKLQEDVDMSETEMIETSSCYDQHFYSCNEIDPRRLSRASAMSLPAGFPPPKPPRIFTVEMSQLRPSLNEEEELNHRNSYINDNKSLPIDLSQVVFRRRNNSFMQSFQSDDSNRKLECSATGDHEGKQKTAFEGYSAEGETLKPLSVKTATCEESHLNPPSKPYAQSSPKIDTSNAITRPVEFPKLSPIHTNVHEQTPQEKSFQAEKNIKSNINVQKDPLQFEKKKRVLDLRKSDPHPLSLLPYLTKSVSEIISDGSSLMKETKSDTNNKGKAYSCHFEGSKKHDDELEALFNLPCDRNERKLDQGGIKPGNSKELKYSETQPCSNENQITTSKLKMKKPLLSVFKGDSIECDVSKMDFHSIIPSKNSKHIMANSSITQSEPCDLEPESSQKENKSGDHGYFSTGSIDSEGTENKVVSQHQNEPEINQERPQEHQEPANQQQQIPSPRKPIYSLLL